MIEPSKVENGSLAIPHELSLGQTGAHHERTLKGPHGREPQSRFVARR